MAERGAEGRRGPPAPERLAGIHPVSEALRARRRRLDRVLVRAGASARRPALAGLIALARESSVPVLELGREEFDARVPEGVRSQGVILEAGPLPTVDLAALSAAGTQPRCLVALDGIEDPQNLGAIARVAEAAGATGLVLPERRAAPLSAAAARASAGALEWLPVSNVVNLPRSLRALKEQGFWIFGADPTGDTDLFAAPDRLFEGDRVLVVGAEGRGVRPGVRATLDVRLSIPLAGHVASLNVATAAAVVLYEWLRRGRAGGRS